MKHKEEIDEIRNMMNTANDGFSNNINSEELKDGVTYLPKKDTGLSLDIIVDCGETYKIYNHPLCIYVIEGESVYPVIINETPYSPYKKSIPSDIISFVSTFRDTLQRFADMEIDGGDFFDALENYRTPTSDRLVVEMSNYGPDKTGLPIWIYVDDTGSYLKSGHNGSYRIKFQQDKNIKNPRLWMPITIPELKVLKKSDIPICKEPKKNVGLVLKWAKGNLNLLIDLRDGKIQGSEFRKLMKKMDEIDVVLDSEC